MNSLKFLTCATLIGSVVLAAGCSNGPLARSEPVVDTGLVPVQISGDRLDTRLKVEGIKARDQGDLIGFEAVIVNDWHASVSFQYQIQWKDAQGFSIDPQGRGWNPVTLDAGASYPIQAVAPNASASSFVIQIKP